MHRFIGIDPGKNGGLAVLDANGELEVVHDMPLAGGQVDAGSLADIIDATTFHGGDGVDVVIVVEQVHSMPKQGVASSFDFGKSYGIVLGVVGALDLRIEHVPPTRWKKAMRLTADKEQARRRALERWPKHSEMFKRKKDADRAEAALLALWFIEQKAERP